jgi:hypothetical protein
LQGDEQVFDEEIKRFYDLKRTETENIVMTFINEENEKQLADLKK